MITSKFRRAIAIGVFAPTLSIAIGLGQAAIAAADKPAPGPGDGMDDVERCMSFGDSLKDCCYWANGTYIKYPNGGEACNWPMPSGSVSKPGTKPARASGAPLPIDATRLGSGQ
jgi:hypothetical protein